MPRLRFGAFLAPHHPVGEHPMLQFRRDLDLVELLDRLGYDEFWCGEHHSSGWEMIASPEMFLAAAGERTRRIRLATGVVSLPYHHPFNVAQRMVQLDHMTGGRAIFGSGPGALASDAHTLGVDPMVLRDRQDEAIGVIRRLFNGERVTARSEWFTLQDAALQLLPLQEEMEFAVASQISPSGMTLAGKHGIGIISIGSLSEEGLNALPTQWSFAEAAAAKHGKTVDRKNWRVLLSWHIAETREKARAEARDGLMRHHNEYITGTLQRSGARPFRTPDEAVDKTAFSSAAVSTIGTPDDLIERIKSVLELSGGFGTVVGFVHDWANPENTMRSWDMVARYVVPEINGYLAGLRKSQDFVTNNRAVFERSREAIMAKINENEAAVAALAVTRSPMLSASASNVPDLTKVRTGTGRSMSGPLAGLRVLDLTTVQMGPWCTRILCDYGADMIKIEAPEGDSSRYTGVPRHRGMSGSFQHNARGKRSIAMDLKQPAAREALLRLVPTVEAFASNIRPQALARLGLDYEAVKHLNPSIVYLSTVGYGSGGRYAGRPAYDDLIQAASGIPMLLQRSTGQPRFIPMAAIDRIVGSAAANALLAGLLARARTGIGQRIEVPMFETMAQFVLAEHMQGTTFDPPTGPPGYARTLSQYRRPYQTKDGFIAVLPYNDGQWRRFFEAIGKAHVVESDPRFADITARTANIDALYEMLSEELKHRTTDEWLDLLQQNDIPCIRPHTLESLLEDRHLADVEFFRFEEHPSEGRIRTMREPSTWSETVPPSGRFAPRLGQHTREVLTEAGYTPGEIDSLIAQRAVMTDAPRG